MHITDFVEPTKHPRQMLAGYKHAVEKESLLRFCLLRCIEAGDIDALVKTKLHHPSMVSDGLLECEGDKLYRLTCKSKILLRTQYGVN